MPSEVIKEIYQRVLTEIDSLLDENFYTPWLNNSFSEGIPGYKPGTFRSWLAYMLDIMQSDEDEKEHKYKNICYQEDRDLLVKIVDSIWIADHEFIGKVLRGGVFNSYLALYAMRFFIEAHCDKTDEAPRLLYIYSMIRAAVASDRELHRVESFDSEKIQQLNWKKGSKKRKQRKRSISMVLDALEKLRRNSRQSQYAAGQAIASEIGLSFGRVKEILRDQGVIFPYKKRP